MTKSKTIILPLAGGLGNQLFQFAHALSSSNDTEVHFYSNLLSVRKNKNGDPEIMDFRLPSNVKANLNLKKSRKFFRRFVSLILRIGGSGLPNQVKKIIFVVLAPIASLLLLLSTGQIAVIRAATNIGFSEIKKSTHTIFCIGYFQSYIWLEKNPDVLLQLKYLELSQISQTCLDFVKSSSHKKILGIHIRLGDYRMEPKIGLLPREYYERAISSLPLVVYDEVWIFSNDRNGAEELLPGVDSLKLVWIPETLTSAETLTLMTYCNDFIISNSTFSWWGAYLNRKSNGVVVCPEKWFKGAEDPFQICPPNWVRIPSF
jgi:hypothetical protein